MKVLTYTSYKEHCDLYTKIHGLIAVNSCQVGLAQNDIILLSKASLIVYKTAKRTGVTSTYHMGFTNSEGTYSIEDFNAKIKIAILQQRKAWEPPQIKDLRLVIPKEHLFMANNTLFFALGIQDNYLQRSTLVRSTLHPASCKTSLDTSPPPKVLSLQCKLSKSKR